MQIPMDHSGKWPLNRRDLQWQHAHKAVVHLLDMCWELKLFHYDPFRSPAQALSNKLYRLVKRRHTHLWKKSELSQRESATDSHGSST